MLMAAWALLHSAIVYTRRQRLAFFLNQYLQSSTHPFTSLICRRRRSEPDKTRIGTIYRASSESSVYKGNSHNQLDQVLFFNEKKEIVAHKAKFVLQLSEWKFFGFSDKLLPFFLKRISRGNMVQFALRLSHSDPESLANGIHDQLHITHESTNSLCFGQYYEVKEFATALAHLKSDLRLQLFECSLDNFILLLLAWVEDSLFFDNRYCIEEIYSVKLSSDDQNLRSSPLIEINKTTREDPLNSYFRSFCSSPCTEIFSSDSNEGASQSRSLLEVLFQNENGLVGTRSSSVNMPQWQSEMFLSTESLFPLNKTTAYKYDENRFSYFSNSLCPVISSSGLDPSQFDALIPRRTGNIRGQQKRRHRFRSLNEYQRGPQSVETICSKGNETAFLKAPESLYCVFNSETFVENDLHDNGYHRDTKPTVLSGEKKCIIETKRNNDDGPSCSSYRPVVDLNPAAIRSHILNHVSSGFYSSFPVGRRHFKNADEPRRFPSHVKIKEVEQANPAIDNRLFQLQSNRIGVLGGKGIRRRRFTSLMAGSCDYGNFSPSFDQAQIPVSNQQCQSPNKNSFDATLSSFRISSGANLQQRTCRSSGSIISHLFCNRSQGRRRRYVTMSSVTDTNTGVAGNGPPLSSSLPGSTHITTNKKTNVQNSTVIYQKPPSFFVYTGDNENLFAKISNCFQNILPRDVYTVFHLSTDSLRRHHWDRKNCVCLLIADTEKLDDEAWLQLQSIFVNSGKLMFICENNLFSSLTICDSTKMQSKMLKSAFGNKSLSLALGKDFEKFLKKTLERVTKMDECNTTFNSRNLIGGSYSVFLQKKKNQPLVLYMQNSACNACALFSDATIEQILYGSEGSIIVEALARLGIKIHKGENEVPKLTSGYLICRKEAEILGIPKMTYSSAVGVDPMLRFFSTGTAHFDEVTSDLIPIEVRRRCLSIPSRFDHEKYFQLLDTKKLGHILLYVPVCETTMKISKSLSAAFPDFDKILVVAGAQTQGRGRTGNKWISPDGCALFTFNLNVPIDSDIGKSITFLQHILAVSTADAISSLIDKPPDFPIKIKWPNDLYFGRAFKLGGILVQASVKNDRYECLLAAGLNVSNSKPTTCINDMLSADCSQQLTVEEVVAQIMNKFEYYLNMFVTEGKLAFCSAYYNFWMHAREEVTIQNKEFNQHEKVIIRGLDESGYLEVRSKKTNQIFSVRDDGNSFDLMKGLIHEKI